MLNAELKILAGKYQGKAIPLTTKRFLVGREQDCQLRPNSELVSRHHCVFIIDDYTVRLRDLGSTNGTRVNGDLVRGEIVLNPGDRVTIGRLEVELVVRTAAPAQSDAATAPTNAGQSSVAATTEMPALASLEVLSANANQGSDTSFEIPVQPPLTPAEGMPTVANIGGDTAIIAGAAGAPMVPLAMSPQMMPMGYPMGYGFPMQGFPGMPGYGYGMPMQGYPMGMPGMPMMPQYPMQPAAAATEKAAGTGTVGEQPVRLPDPSTTGAKPPTPAPAAPAGQQPATISETPSTSAGDIIKQFMQRRTTS